MEGQGFFRNSQIVVLGVCIAIATIVSTVILSQAVTRAMRFSKEVISVTGAAEKKIVSDYTVWRLSFSKRAASMTETFELLKTDLGIVKEYLLSKGVKEDEITIAQTQTMTLYKKNEKGNDTNEIEAYILTQPIEVKSDDVNKVTDVSRESTELITRGIELVSDAPQYFYTKLAELKIEMLREATKDAKKRAEEIASSSGNKIGAIRSARMGVFQITPVNSYDVSDWGTNDTSSLEKKVNAVVRADFAIVG